MKKFNTELYLVTDSSGLSRCDFLYKVEEAIRGGVSIVQLREKNISTREYIEKAVSIKKVTDKYGIPLIIDDRVDVALASEAAGVHLGSEDMDVAFARKILGDNAIVGATAKTVESAVKAEDSGADYLGVGAIYPTTTKVKTVLTSVDTLRAIREAVKIKVNAIGGLNVENLDILKNTEIDGICVVSAIMKSRSPREEALRLLNRFKEISGNFEQE